MASELSHILRVLESMDKNLKNINSTLKAQNKTIADSKDSTGKEAAERKNLIQGSFSNYIPFSEED